jgi:hypothetical protein
MRELLARGKNTIDPDVIDPGGRSVEDSPVKSDFTFTLPQFPIQTATTMLPVNILQHKKLCKSIDFSSF